MGKKMRNKVFSAGLTLLSFLCLMFLTFFFSKDVPGSSLSGSPAALNWKKEQKSEHYKGEELYGYINGGAEIFFEYGFKELYVSHYTALSNEAKKELTLEVYKMESPESAFGIFSTKRTGDEKVSKQVKVLHWVSPTQVNMVKAEFFINIVGFNCAEGELEKFAIPIPGRVQGKSALPKLLDLIPAENRIPNSERYIKGQVAASGESVFLQKEFWGFKEGARAVSARYIPSDSKIIIIDFGQEKTQLAGLVRDLFEEHMENVEIMEDFVQGELPFGGYFFFEQMGKIGVLVLGEKDWETANWLIEQVYEKIK